MSMEIIVHRPDVFNGGHVDGQVPVDVVAFDWSGCPVHLEEGSELTFDLQRDGEGWILRIHGSVDAETCCHRCLATARIELPVDFYARILPRGEALPEDEDEREDIIPRSKDGKTIDVAGRVREELILALPTKILCSPDCRGLCPICGQDLNRGSCDCSTEEIDPRMKELEKLKRQLSGTQEGVGAEGGR
ncbi:MAG: DUF177 domain-containing protein [Bacillota bacterium]